MHMFSHIDADFSDLSFTVTVPATYNTTGDSDYEVFHSSIIIDDVQVENTQIFAVVTILDKDVPDDLACFQRQLNDTECFGRSGAVEFRIFDNDQSKDNSVYTHATFVWGLCVFVLQWLRSVWRRLLMRYQKVFL